MRYNHFCIKEENTMKSSYANLLKNSDTMQYYVIKSYASKQNFISRHSAQLLWSQENCNANIYTEADVLVNKDDKHLFQVDLIVNINAIESSTQRSVFEIHIIFTSIAFIDDSITDLEREKILMVNIPQESFGIVQEMVKQMTENAGYNAPIIESIDFEQQYVTHCHLSDTEIN